MSLLLPAGGAITITEYGHCRSLHIRSLIKHVKFGARSDIACLSYNNFLFHGETSKI